MYFMLDCKILLLCLHAGANFVQECVTQQKLAVSRCVVLQYISALLYSVCPEHNLHQNYYWLSAIIKLVIPKKKKKRELQPLLKKSYCLQLYSPQLVKVINYSNLSNCTTPFVISWNLHQVQLQPCMGCEYWKLYLHQCQFRKMQ